MLSYQLFYYLSAHPAKWTENVFPSFQYCWVPHFRVHRKNLFIHLQDKQSNLYRCATIHLQWIWPRTTRTFSKRVWDTTKNPVFLLGICRRNFSLRVGAFCRFCRSFLIGKALNDIRFLFSRRTVQSFKKWGSALYCAGAVCRLKGT